MTKTSGPFKRASKTYMKRGWLPLPVTGKFPPVVGATGRDGRVDEFKVADWRETHPDHNLALRADGWVAIDVDHYDDKHGADTLAEYEARLGKLPPTYRSTSRGADNPSGQRFYALPPDTQLVTKIGSDIEVVQSFHRYSVVYPSVHPTTGTTYEWLDPKGRPCDIPEVIFLPELPEAWLDELSREPAAPLASGVTVVPWRQLTESFPTGTDCLAVEVYRAELNELTANGHVGHDDAVRLALRGFMLGREGHTGVADHLDFLYRQFTAYIATHRERDGREPDQVFRDTASTAQRKVVLEECRCPKAGELSDDDLTGVVDPNLAFLLAQPILVPGTRSGAVNLEVAAARFCHEYPVRRHRGSNGATYLWTGDRWEIGDVAEYVFRWLAKTMGTDFRNPKAKELAEYILVHAPAVDDTAIDTRYISCTNGLLDWQTGELRQRSKDVFVFNHLPIAWRPAARPGRFQEWIDSAIEPAQRAAVWEALGYAVSPQHDLKVALALTGPGGGGKSTFVNVMTQLVGPDNTTALSPNMMGERFMKAELFGKTLNAAGDVGAETLTNLGMFKAIVAGDAISAEFKGKDPFSYRPRTFNVASFNVLPAVEQNDSAFWDRWLVLPFAHRFNRGGKSDNYYRDRMPYDRGVMEGVLVQAVAALQRLRERGGFDPAVFGPAKDEWRAQADSIAAYVQDYLSVETGGRIRGTELLSHYKQVSERNGRRPRGQIRFYADLVAYLEEKYPGKAGRVPKAGNHAAEFYGFKVILDPGNELGDPSAIYGRTGWTLRVD